MKLDALNPGLPKSNKARHTRMLSGYGISLEVFFITEKTYFKVNISGFLLIYFLST